MLGNGTLDHLTVSYLGQPRASIAKLPGVPLHGAGPCASGAVDVNASSESYCEAMMRVDVTISASPTSSTPHHGYEKPTVNDMIDRLVASETHGTGAYMESFCNRNAMIGYA